MVPPSKQHKSQIPDVVSNQLIPIMLCFEEAQQQQLIKTKCVECKYMQGVYTGHRNGPLSCSTVNI